MEKGQKIYIKEDAVRFRKPSNAQDGIENMSKGQELLFVDGPWFRVEKNGQQGWVHADYIIEDNPSPVPQLGNVNLIVGEPNNAQSPNTIEVRRLINDILNGGKRGDALQCTEYVS